MGAALGTTFLGNTYQSSMITRGLGVTGRIGAAVDLAVSGPLAIAAGLAALWLLKTPEVRAWPNQRGLSMLHGGAQDAWRWPGCVAVARMRSGAQDA